LGKSFRFRRQRQFATDQQLLEECLPWLRLLEFCKNEHLNSDNVKQLQAHGPGTSCTRICAWAFNRGFKTFPELFFGNALIATNSLGTNGGGRCCRQYVSNRRGVPSELRSRQTT